MTNPPANLLKIGEVATELGVSTETIRNWVRRKRVPAYKMPSGQLRFRREDIDTFIQRVGAA